MIENIKGDLFKTDCKHIAHGVNCQGVMGAGVAKIVRERFPESYKYYVKICDSKTPVDLLGTNLVCPEENGKQIIHCFTQNNIGYRKRYVSYDAIVSCFEALHGINEIAIPKIGSGLGGGNWNIIESIIMETLVRDNGMDVKIYSL